jgi:glycosyltransferase involved in cell wall biosynthesis
MSELYNVGDIRNGTEVLPRERRKKILLLADDIRMFSGISTMAREFVMGMVHRYNFFTVGGAVKHPDRGKLFDLSEDMRSKTGVPDAEVKVLPWDGYGTPDLVRNLITTENPDAILHFTDPRYWIWLYQMEHEIRQHIPIMYYSIWDNVGEPPNFDLDPIWNAPYYVSSNGLFCISKQTYGMTQRILKKKYGDEFDNIHIRYVPHGINNDTYKRVYVPTEFKNQIFGENEYDFVLFWSNRNIRRKQPSDVIYAYKLFCDKLDTDVAKKTCLVLHTKPVDENGTNLYDVVNAVRPAGHVIFSDKYRSQEELNYLYNLADCTINIAGNEGFGLTTAESVMAGTPIIVNVTGGMQDQCGFTLNGTPFTADDYTEIGTLHRKTWKSTVKWGEWVFPIWSSVHTINGSIPTPYIWDDRVNLDELADVIYEVYDTPAEERKRRGMAGRNAFLNELGLSATNMVYEMTMGVEEVLKNWKPRKRWELFKVN